MKTLKFLSLSFLLIAVQSLCTGPVLAQLTGSGPVATNGQTLLPFPGDTGPPVIDLPAYVDGTTSFTGAWGNTAANPWRGTFTGTGERAAVSTPSTGTNLYNFSGLTTGVLPVNTFFNISDLDAGSGNSETISFTAYDSSGLITAPWLEAPSYQWGSGSQLASMLPTYVWDAVSSTYTFDGNGESFAGNPNTIFSMFNNVAILELEVTDLTGFAGYSLAAPPAPPCIESATALDELIDGSIPLCSGDKTFSEFAYSPIGDMPPASDIIVHPITDDAGHFGIRFQGAFFDTSAAGASDAIIEFQVDAPDGKLIKDVHLEANPLAIGGDGFVSITETFLPENDQVVLSAYDIHPGSRQLHQWEDLLDENGELAPVKSLHVQKDILAMAQSDGAVATMSFIDQTFSQCDESEEFPGVCESSVIGGAGELPGDLGTDTGDPGDIVVDDSLVIVSTDASLSGVSSSATPLGAQVASDWQLDSVVTIFGSEEIGKESLSPPGDIDADGAVSFSDFLILSDSFGSDVVANTLGDLDGDGIVAFTDFLILSNDFGGTSASATESVPEPSALFLLGFAGLCGCVFRRRK